MRNFNLGRNGKRHHVLEVNFRFGKFLQFMPARTNEFQKIVYLVKTHAATDGATVTESKSLYDFAAKRKREVDVVIERLDGTKKTIIGIECVKTKRKAGVQWVEQQLQKHRDLATDVLILYSHGGFWKSAIVKAKHYKKTVIAMESLDESDAERLFNGASTLWAKQGQLEPTKVVFRVPATSDLPEESFLPFPDTGIFNAAGEPQINPSDLIPWLLQQPFGLPEFLKIGNATHKGFLMRLTPPTDYWGNRLFVKKEDVTPNILRPIDMVEITGNAAFFTTLVPVEHGKWVRIPWPGVLWRSVQRNLSWSPRRIQPER